METWPSPEDTVSLYLHKQNIVHSKVWTSDHKTLNMNFKKRKKRNKTLHDFQCLTTSNQPGSGSSSPRKWSIKFLASPWGWSSASSSSLWTPTAIIFQWCVHSLLAKKRWYAQQDDVLFCQIRMLKVFCLQKLQNFLEKEKRWKEGSA